MFHEDYKKRSLKLIEKNGYFVQYVMAEDGILPYAYTSGLSYAREERFPEFVIGGIDPEIANVLLNDLVRAARSADFVPYGAGYYAGLIEGAEVGVVPIDPQRSRCFLGVPTDAETYLIVLPDAKGLFPWDRGCDPKFARQIENFDCLALPYPQNVAPSSGVLH